MRDLIILGLLGVGATGMAAAGAAGAAALLFGLACFKALSMLLIGGDA